MAPTLFQCSTPQLPMMAGAPTWILPTTNSPVLSAAAAPPTIDIPTMTFFPATEPAVQTPTSSTVQQYPLSVTMCMEVVWHGEFERLFNSFAQYHQHDWALSPTASPPPDSDGYKLFQDSAKVRFSCEECGRGWTSMKGRVAFWFQLNQLNKCGDVLFKLYGQQCQRCQNEGKECFYHAMWYPEEVVKVIQNLYNRVGTAFYGFQLPPIRIDRRNGKPRAQHDAKLCQACKDGICREGWTLN